MALPINIEDLLRKQKIEGNRIEFKSGWNPDSIYHSICAFANDFDNIGGGYILVGVEEENGIAKRPIKGLPVQDIDGILKDMVGYNNKFSPYYMPRTSVEEVDDKQILVIWAPAGTNRPYDQVSVQVSVQVKSLIMCMNSNELSVNEILSVYKLVHKHTYKSHHYFKKNFIVPAIEGEYVDMSYPNKPTHPHQKYRLTAKGLQLKDLLSKQK